MKKIILFISLYLFSFHVYSSTEETQDIRQWLEKMFEHLDKSKVPQGLLRDYAFEMADLDIYNGKELNDSNYVNKIAFENLLRTISSASVTPDTFDPEDILHKQNMMNQPNCGIIGIVLYQYSYIKANALSDNLIKYEL